MVDFFSRLSKEDIIELINDCMEADRAEGAWTAFTDKVDEVLVYNEDDRLDENGERFAWVRGISNKTSLPKYVADFRINDFYMCYGDNLPHEYNNVLRMFMTRKFGLEYINALYRRRNAEATTEYNQLMEYLAVVRGGEGVLKQ